MNLPASVRQTIYIITVVATPTMTYLNQQGAVTDFVFGLFSVVVSAVAGLAAVNTNVTPEE